MYEYLSQLARNSDQLEFCVTSEPPVFNQFIAARNRKALEAQEGLEVQLRTARKLRQPGNRKA